jgi:hypothetical protein
MLDTHHVYESRILIDAVDHAVITAPRSAIPLQVMCERFIDSVWVGCQGAEAKLDGSGGDLLRGPIEPAASALGKLHPVASAAHAVSA